MNTPKGKYAWTVKVGEKGQFVIPKEAREVFDIKPGDTLIVLGDEKRGIAIPPKNQMNKIMATLFGISGIGSEADGDEEDSEEEENE